MSSLPSTALSLPVFERLQLWRRRQRALWPGLFQPSLLGAKAQQAQQEKDVVPTKITVQFNRNKSSHVLVNDVPVVLCDACGSLQPVCELSTSSASTLPPSPAVIDHPIDPLRCSACAFVTPLGPVRKVLRLPPCGPYFEQHVSFALLVEAVGAPHAIKSCPDDHRSWFLDAQSRTFGLDALILMLGIADEQVCNKSANISKPLPFLSAREYAIETERFIDGNGPHVDAPRIPFSIADLVAPSDSAAHRAKAADRSAHLANEAQRVWRTMLASSERSIVERAMIKVDALAFEFRCEQDKARLRNHTECGGIKRRVQATQQQPAPDEG